MKKINLFVLTSVAFALGVTTHNDNFKEEAMDVSGVAPITFKRNMQIGADEEFKSSKTYVQYSTIDGKDSLRFATAVKGNIGDITYVRKGIGDEEDKVKVVTTIYKAVMANGKATYFDGTKLTTDDSVAGNYYWACYTIKYTSNTYKSTDIQIDFKVNQNVQSTKIANVHDENPINQVDLTLNNCEITRIGSNTIVEPTSIENNIRTYKIAKGKEITIKADEEQANKMFVGFDLNEVNNRFLKPGVKEQSFVVGEENMSINAIYNDLTNNVLLTNNNGAATSISGGSVASAETLVDSSDPDLEGLDGYTVHYKGKTTKDASGYTINNIKGALFDTTNEKVDGVIKQTCQDFTYKVIFKNRSQMSLTLELYALYCGNLATTGQVDIAKGKTVTAYFTMNGYMPSSATAGLKLIWNLNNDAISDVPVDIVIGRARTYSNDGYIGNETPDLPTLGYVRNIDGKWMDASGFKTGREQAFSDSSSMMFAKENSGCITNDKNYNSTKITNAKKGENVKLYVKIRNLVGIELPMPYKTKFTLRITNNANPFASGVEDLATPIDVEVTDRGLVGVYEFVISNPSNSTIYFHFANVAIETSLKTFSINFSAQFAYNNVFGYQA